LQVLALPDSSMENLFSHLPNLASCLSWARESLETEARYAVYLDRQKLDIARVEKDQAIAIPEDFDYALLSGLSNELRVKLELIRPRTVAEAADIEGITPSALVLISASLRRKSKNVADAAYPKCGSAPQSSAL
jgi:tRNA uridine 5-carboxymethylaminomethyl modification enzyme